MLFEKVFAGNLGVCSLTAVRELLETSFRLFPSLFYMWTRRYVTLIGVGRHLMTTRAASLSQKEMKVSKVKRTCVLDDINELLNQTNPYPK